MYFIISASNTLITHFKGEVQSVSLKSWVGIIGGWKSSVDLQPILFLQATQLNLLPPLNDFTMSQLTHIPSSIWCQSNSKVACGFIYSFFFNPTAFTCYLNCMSTQKNESFQFCTFFLFLLSLLTKKTFVHFKSYKYFCSLVKNPKQ